MRATKIHAFLRYKFRDWGKSWCYLKISELNGLLSSFSKSEVEYFGFLGAIGRNETQRKALHRIDAVLCPAVPSHWKYIAYGWAQK